jgi:probable HAF family extracellular repeat protein
MNACCSTQLRLLWKYVWSIGGALPLAACLGGSDSVPAVRHAIFLNLGLLPGYTSSQASAVSSDGSVVVGTASTAAGNRQAFRWNGQQGIVGIRFMPNGTYSVATAVSANGTVIAGTGDATDSDPPTSSVGFRWTAGAGVQRVDALPGSNLCYAAGVSGDGAVIVGTCLQVNNTAFRWTASSGSVPLDRFGTGSSQQSTATAISSDGSVIAGAGHPVLTGAVIWAANASPTVIGKLPGDATAVAMAVSTGGSVVVGSSMDNAGTSRAFRWTQQTGMVALGDGMNGLLGSFATSVSSSGSIIVGYGPTATGDIALIWDADHGLRSLEAALTADYQTQIAGWKLIRATAISNDGHTIAGYGTNPQRQTEAWIVNLPG